MIRVAGAIMALVPWVAEAQTCYDGDAFPESRSWIRQISFPKSPARREIRNGWFVQYIRTLCDPPEINCGNHDSYLGDLLAYDGEEFFVEWRMITDCPEEEINNHNGCALVVLVGGPVTFHFNMASGLMRLVRGYQYPVLYFDIDRGVPHTYRLEVFGADWFEFFIDGELAAADTPEDTFPTDDALISWGARVHLSGHTPEWDYVKFGILTEPGKGKCDPNDRVDLKDYRMFQWCLRRGGPDRDIFRPNCLFYDYDKDNDIDLRDVAAFQNAFTGSKE